MLEYCKVDIEYIEGIGDEELELKDTADSLKWVTFYYELISESKISKIKSEETV
jgi:hypothetical protein